MGQTVAEKVLANRSGSSGVSAGEYVVCGVDVAMVQDVHAPAVFNRLDERGISELWDPSKVVVVFDHVAPSHGVDDADTKARVRRLLESYGVEHFYDVGTGISHLVLPERGHVRPGEVVIGTDSHTVSHGVFGAAGTGVGDTDMVYALLTGEVWFRVPETIRIHLTGDLPPHVSSKDVVLSLAANYGLDVARYRAIEFTGPVVEDLSIDDRMTLTNMSIELGAKFGFTPVDERVEEYVRCRTDEPFAAVEADPDVDYETVIEHDVTGLEPQVARPHDVDNVVPVSAVEGVDVDQVFVGTCTNGSYDDLAAVAALLSGNEVAPDTRMIVTPATRAIYQRATRDGLIETLTQAGATVTNATCGPCLGLGMGIIGEGETCFAAQNRNYRGRMGSDESEIYLGSPETAAATAISGHIADPREV
ncbi:3-isopropylmalate dehydratase large subunit [Halalkalicoccus sp. NIPERK01]|uniref:3-isopropylmalate dehydratase large subunit n=1 Tax=Halalkalicoccus sp. NIPERK01 TaxID=3053469 RepID=UPI00256F1F84|nr:3-isopropylmalate dehydratase large subunit [Halalkalicoccus sp. NIPERK01]MDL5363467.1 3-isopropylmalate dehydratase large subunit [Halalkalicoccus sp. NIPERK01]